MWSHPAAALTAVCAVTTTLPLSLLHCAVQVCGAAAHHHRHYGALACYSCRAFFRRTVLRIQQKGLKRCRNGLGKCVVTSTAKACIHCRYQRCLKIGMVPDKLKVRFCLQRPWYH